MSMLCTFWSWGLLNPMLARRGLTTDRLIAWGLPSSLIVLAHYHCGPASGAGGRCAGRMFCMTSTFVSAGPAGGGHGVRACAGRACLSAYNLVIFLGVFVVQWGIGLLVDAFAGAGLVGTVAPSVRPWRVPVRAAWRPICISCVASA
jgi:hypothetical protein